MKKICILLIIIFCISTVYTANAEKQPVDKIVYLTFDDGPSNNTYRILDILKQYDVKATFFVVRREKYNDAYQRILLEGHTLGGHSSSHRYDMIYRSSDAYYTDLNDLSNYIYRITKYRYNIIRFPGGSNNTISIKYSNPKIMDEITINSSYEGYTYYDWNVDSEDASSTLKTKEQLAFNVINQCKEHRESIVLMHDCPNNTTTPDSLPIIIKTLRKEGYQFKAITSDTKVIKFK